MLPCVRLLAPAGRPVLRAPDTRGCSLSAMKRPLGRHPARLVETESGRTNSRSACSRPVVERAGRRSAMWQRNRWTGQPPSARSGRSMLSDECACQTGYCRSGLAVEQPQSPATAIRRPRVRGAAALPEADRLSRSNRLTVGSPWAPAPWRNHPAIVGRTPHWAGYRDRPDLPNFCISIAMACGDGSPEFAGARAVTDAGAGILGCGAAAPADSNPTRQYSS